MPEGTLICLLQGCRRDLTSLPTGNSHLAMTEGSGAPTGCHFHSLSLCVPELMGRAGALTYSAHSEERKGTHAQKAAKQPCLVSPVLEMASSRRAEGKALTSVCPCGI